MGYIARQAQPLARSSALANYGGAVEFGWRGGLGEYAAL